MAATVHTVPTSRTECLSGHNVLRSTKLDDLEEAVSRRYTRHHLGLLQRDPRVDAVFNSVNLGQIAVGYLRYGADIRMNPETMTSCYHINIPVAGHSESVCGRTTAVSSPGRAAVFVPGQPITLRWSADCAQLMLKIDRSRLEAELQAIVDRDVRLVDFELGMDLTTSLGQSWLATLRLLVGEIDRPGSLMRHPLLLDHFQRVLMTALLFTQPHNYTSLLTGEQRAARPRSVQRAIDMMEDRPEHPHSVEDLAAHARVSVRALQAGFRRYVGTTPMGYLNGVRLRRVERELAEAAPDSVTVTQVAYRWGFTHHGRFAAAYRERFGCSPSETLRKAR